MRQMKDSGLPWVGLIPDTWLNCRNDSVFTERKEFCTADEPMENLLSVSEYYGVAKRTNKMEEGEFISRAETLDGYRRCHKGDLVMNYMLAWKGSQATTQYDGVVSPAYAVFKPLGGMLPQFAHFLFRTSMYCTVFEMHSTGIIKSRLRLYPDSFLHLHSILPPLEEQHRIVNFLDKKCAEIDSLTADVQKEIEILQEYRRSLITEAVTKGLDPDVEMKDSGVVWMGSIPKKWKIKAAKYCVVIRNGSDPKTEGDIPVYGSGTGSFRTCGEYKEGPAVLLGRKGSIDTPHYIKGKYWNVDTAFDVRTKQGYLLRFYYYVAMSFDYKYYISQTTLPSMTQTDYGNMRIPCPDAEEQGAIVMFLDTKCNEIDSVLEGKQKQLETLAEYRKSLIYEYVTGKKEVI